MSRRGYRWLFAILILTVGVIYFFNDDDNVIEQSEFESASDPVQVISAEAPAFKLGPSDRNDKLIDWPETPLVFEDALARLNESCPPLTDDEVGVSIKEASTPDDFAAVILACSSDDQFGIAISAALAAFPESKLVKLAAIRMSKSDSFKGDLLASFEIDSDDPFGAMDAAVYYSRFGATEEWVDYLQTALSEGSKIDDLADVDTQRVKLLSRHGRDGQSAAFRVAIGSSPDGRAGSMLAARDKMIAAAKENPERMTDLAYLLELSDRIVQSPNGEVLRKGLAIFGQREILSSFTQAEWENAEILFPGYEEFSAQIQAESEIFDETRDIQAMLIPLLSELPPVKALEIYSDISVNGGRAYERIEMNYPDLYKKYQQAGNAIFMSKVRVIPDATYWR